MDVRQAISGRRSIRRFRDEPLADEQVRAILEAGTQAPSGKNRQPWRFVVVPRERRSEMIRVFRDGLATAKANGYDIGSGERTADVMEQAPLTVFVLHPAGDHPWVEQSEDQRWTEVVNIQSIGAAIQNMLLTAHELGIGSLWICDVFWAYTDLLEWLGETCQMIAAVSFGYADEHPGPRPRKGVDEVTHWL